MNDYSDNLPPENNPDYSDNRPDHNGALIASVLMMIVGWGGLYQVVTTMLPQVAPRWMFFVLLHVAVTGTVLPMVRYLNLRFTPIDVPLPPSGVLVRQSVWFGLFAVACAWLQIPRALSWPVAFFLALIFVVIEVFLRTREMAEERADD
jgi:hypothetical protein